MNQQQAKAVVARITNLWPGSPMTPDLVSLWTDTLATMDYDPVLAAIHEFRRRPEASYGPDIGRILEIASAQAPPDEAANRRAEYAREAEACRQDHEANRRFLDEQDAGTLATAKEWLSQQPFAAGLIRSAEKGRVKMAAAFLVLAIRHRLWEKGPKWWEHLKVANPLS